MSRLGPCQMLGGLSSQHLKLAQFNCLPAAPFRALEKPTGRSCEVSKNWKSASWQLALHCIKGSHWLQDASLGEHKGCQDDPRCVCYYLVFLRLRLAEGGKISIWIRLYKHIFPGGAFQHRGRRLAKSNSFCRLLALDFASLIFFKCFWTCNHLCYPWLKDLISNDSKDFN